MVAVQVRQGAGDRVHHPFLHRNNHPTKAVVVPPAARVDGLAQDDLQRAAGSPPQTMDRAACPAFAGGAVVRFMGVDGSIPARWCLAIPQNLDGLPLPELRTLLDLLGRQ